MLAPVGSSKVCLSLLLSLSQQAASSSTDHQVLGWDMDTLPRTHLPRNIHPSTPLIPFMFITRGVSACFQVSWWLHDGSPFIQSTTWFVLHLLTGSITSAIEETLRRLSVVSLPPKAEPSQADTPPPSPPPLPPLSPSSSLPPSAARWLLTSSNWQRWSRSSPRSAIRSRLIQQGPVHPSAGTCLTPYSLPLSFFSLSLSPSLAHGASVPLSVCVWQLRSACRCAQKQQQRRV